MLKMLLLATTCLHTVAGHVWSMPCVAHAHQAWYTLMTNLLNTTHQVYGLKAYGHACVSASRGRHNTTGRWFFVHGYAHTRLDCTVMPQAGVCCSDAAGGGEHAVLCGRCEQGVVYLRHDASMTQCICALIAIFFVGMFFERKEKPCLVTKFNCVW